MDLKEKPETFTVDALGATCVLGSQFDDNADDQYTLYVDGVAFDALPEVTDKGAVPEVGHSEAEETNGANTVRFDFLVFLKGKRAPVSIEFNFRSGHLSLEICGKPVEDWQVKEISEAFAVPYVFDHEGFKFTVKMQVDDKGNMTEKPELEIQGIPFSKHPYMDKDFVLDGEETPIFNS